MAMSDAEYARVVEDLKQSKQRGDGDYDMRLMYVNASYFVWGVHATALHASRAAGNPDAFKATVDRAEALHTRYRNLPKSQMTEALHDVAWKHGKLGVLTDASSPEAFDRAIAAIDAELQLAERRRR